MRTNTELLTEDEGGSKFFDDDNNGVRGGGYKDDETSLPALIPSVHSVPVIADLALATYS